MKRLIIYFFWDKDGVVDDYIPCMLKSLKSFAAEMCMIVNGDINQEGKNKVKPYIDNLLVRENKGLDAEAYKYVIYHYGFDKLKEYDEVLCTNFTYFGPFYPLDELFDTMNKKDCDWWGLYRWPISNPIYHHIPSYFVAYRKSLLITEDFAQYWQTMKPIKTYRDSCLFHEQRQTIYYDERGYKNAVYFENHFKYKDNWSFHWPLKNADSLIIDERFPFIKRRNFFLETYMSGYDEALDNAIPYIKHYLDYDFNMIKDNILRTADKDLLERCNKKIKKNKFKSKFTFSKRKKSKYLEKANLMQKYVSLFTGIEIK